MTAQDGEASPEMAARTVFELITPAANDGCLARLGRLALPGRRPVETPTYTAITSRGVVPHLTPDNVHKHTSFGAAYMALEDFIEKNDPPIYHIPSGSRTALHTFTAFPSDLTTIMAPRRCPPVPAPLGSNAKSVPVFTSTGFHNLTVGEFTSAVKSLQPDVVVALANLPPKVASSQSSKVIRMVERTEVWLDEFLDQLHSDQQAGRPVSAVFAPVLSVEHGLQWDYLRHLAEDVSHQLSGLAVYDVNVVPDLVTYKPLTGLPRLSLHPPQSPADVLRYISLGIDICALPFINSVSDSGVALTFTFSPSEAAGIQPLGTNIWSPEHKASTAPIMESCSCYTCSTHHRAYLHHLLNAKEMLGWNLLQIHNHQVMSDFFSGVRDALRQGVDKFEACSNTFLTLYDSCLPKGTAERPRARGYHFKSELGQEKINRPNWSELNVDSTAESPAAEGHEHGVLPDIDTPEVPPTLIPDGWSNGTEEAPLGRNK